MFCVPDEDYPRNSSHPLISKSAYLVVTDKIIQNAYLQFHVDGTGHKDR